MSSSRSARGGSACHLLSVDRSVIYRSVKRRQAQGRGGAFVKMDPWQRIPSGCAPWPSCGGCATASTASTHGPPRRRGVGAGRAHVVGPPQPRVQACLRRAAVLLPDDPSDRAGDGPAAARRPVGDRRVLRGRVLLARHLQHPVHRARRGCRRAPTATPSRPARRTWSSRPPSCETKKVTRPLRRGGAQTSPGPGGGTQDKRSGIEKRPASGRH